MYVGMWCGRNVQIAMFSLQRRQRRHCLYENDIRKGKYIYTYMNFIIPYKNHILAPQPIYDSCGLYHVLL